MAVGVARPMAQGQAISSTETAATKAKLSAGAGPKAQGECGERERQAELGIDHAYVITNQPWSPQTIDMLTDAIHGS